MAAAPRPNGRDFGRPSRTEENCGGRGSRGSRPDGERVCVVGGSCGFRGCCRKGVGAGHHDRPADPVISGQRAAAAAAELRTGRGTSCGRRRRASPAPTMPTVMGRAALWARPGLSGVGRGWRGGRRQRPLLRRRTAPDTPVVPDTGVFTAHAAAATVGGESPAGADVAERGRAGAGERWRVGVGKRGGGREARVRERGAWVGEEWAPAWGLPLAGCRWVALGTKTKRVTRAPIDPPRGGWRPGRRAPPPPRRLACGAGQQGGGMAE